MATNRKPAVRQEGNLSILPGIPITPQEMRLATTVEELLGVAGLVKPNEHVTRLVKREITKIAVQKSLTQAIAAAHGQLHQHITQQAVLARAQMDTLDPLVGQLTELEQENWKASKINFFLTQLRFLDLANQQFTAIVEGLASIPAEDEFWDEWSWWDEFSNSLNERKLERLTGEQLRGWEAWKNFFTGGRVATEKLHAFRQSGQSRWASQNGRAYEEGEVIDADYQSQE